MAIPRVPDVGPPVLIDFPCMTLTPAQNGLLKGVALAILAAVTAYFADANNVAPLLGNSAAILVAAIASAIESHIRAYTGRGLMGAARVR